VPANCHTQSKRFNDKTACNKHRARCSIREEHKSSQRQEASGWQDQESGVFHGIPFRAMFAVESLALRAALHLSEMS
jgi:hypothetical protein